MENKMHYLFSYGTLQLERVQLENYGRLLKGEKDSLLNYKLETVRITDDDVLDKSGEEYHPIAVKTGNPDDRIEGVIFKITEAELQETDLYEGDTYTRVSETFDSGTEAWIYVAKQ
jgi:gamma-glutamylcyclotransferase (GGCT)/AIG2-like uncharacterized protein YtfP